MSGRFSSHSLMADPKPLPVGLQIVGRYRDDFGVLQMAQAFEQETSVGGRRPSIAAEQ